MRRSGAVPVALLPILLVLWEGFGTPVIGRDTDTEILVGACLDVSGPAKLVGSANLRSLEDFVGITNEQGGIFGKRLRVVSKDTKYTARPYGVKAFEEIAGEYHPLLMAVDSTHLMMELLGYTLDERQERLLPAREPLVGIGKKYEALLTSGSMMDDFAQGQIHPAVFVPGPTYGDQLKMLLRYAAREKKGAKVAFVYCDDIPFGFAPIPFARLECRKRNLTVVGEATAPFSAAEAQDRIKSAVEKIHQWDPDYVLIHGFVGQQVPDLVNGCAERDLKCTFLATALSMHEGVLGMLKSVSPGCVYMGVTPPRYWYMDGRVIDQLKSYRRSKWLRKHPGEEYRAKEDYQPIWYMYGALQAMILVEATRKAYELTNGNKPTVSRLVEGLRSIKDFPTGGLTDEPITWRNNRFGVGRIYRADSEKAIFVPVPHARWRDFFLR